MVSGSKLKCPSKVSWGSLTFSLLQCNLQQLFGKCTGRDEKCGKMWKNALVARFYILLIPFTVLFYPNEILLGPSEIIIYQSEFKFYLSEISLDQSEITFDLSELLYYQSEKNI